jgi:predicted transcriptional regulator
MPTTHATPEMSSIPTAFALNRELQARLTALAEASSQQPEQLIEEAVREYVERQEYRNTLSLAGLEAWKRFEASGRKGGISLDEITPWLDSWGTDNELAPPPSMARYTE